MQIRIVFYLFDIRFACKYLSENEHLNQPHTSRISFPGEEPFTTSISSLLSSDESSTTTSSGASPGLTTLRLERRIQLMKSL